MADTGPCGPFTEAIDLSHVARTSSAARRELLVDGNNSPGILEGFFIEGTEAGRFLEFRTLVFIQFAGRRRHARAAAHTVIR